MSINKRMTKAISLIAVLFAGFIFVTGVAAQNTRAHTNPPSPPAVRTSPPAGLRGAGVGAATGLGVGAANGTGIGAANGTGIGSSTGTGSGFGRIVVSQDTPEFLVHTFTVPMVRVNSQTGTAVGTGTGAATGSGVGSATDTSAETPTQAPRTDTRTYIKELNGTCYYVTKDGEKAYVARKKCELY